MYIKVKNDKLKELLEERTCIALLNKEETYLGCINYDTIIIDEESLKFKEQDICGLTLSLDSISYYDEDMLALILK